MSAGSEGDDAQNHRELSAGSFSSWLSDMQSALRGERASDVPCGECTACCTSSQFVDIEPDETKTLSRIPRQLLFPAPGLPKGHVLLGYDENGHCPMLVENRCSIYDDRPRTCRTYDCRVFPAAGLYPDDDEKAAIARQARRWRFTPATDADRNRHAAVRSAATFLGQNQDRFSHAGVPSDPTQLAVLAVEVHDAFLRLDETSGQIAVVSPTPEVVEAEVLRRTRSRDAS
ncbi:MAG: YkgJ family cysteine cluster protein [Actinobacteria bacterium]|nr:YkgJ family cysteine cluster protein [Actinomycetota bacterium]